MRPLAQSNSNYGQVLMIYDVLLGTHYDPCVKTHDRTAAMGDKALSSAGVVKHCIRPLVTMRHFRIRWPRLR